MGSKLGVILGSNIAALQIQEQLQAKGYDTLILEPSTFKGGSINVGSRAISNNLLGHAILSPSHFSKSYYRTRCLKAGIDLDPSILELRKLIDQNLPLNVRKHGIPRFRPKETSDYALHMLSNAVKKRAELWAQDKISYPTVDEIVQLPSSTVTFLSDDEPVQVIAGQYLYVPARNNDFKRLIGSYSPKEIRYNVVLKSLTLVDNSVRIVYSVDGIQEQCIADLVFSTLSPIALSRTELDPRLMTKMPGFNSKLCEEAYERLERLIKLTLPEDLQNLSLKQIHQVLPRPYYGAPLMLNLPGVGFGYQAIPWGIMITTVDLIKAANQRKLPSKFLNQNLQGASSGLFGRRLAHIDDGQIDSSVYQRYNTREFFIYGTTRLAFLDPDSPISRIVSQLSEAGILVATERFGVNPEDKVFLGGIPSRAFGPSFDISDLNFEYSDPIPAGFDLQKIPGEILRLMCKNSNPRKNAKDVILSNLSKDSLFIPVGNYLSYYPVETSDGLQFTPVTYSFLSNALQLAHSITKHKLALH